MKSREWGMWAKPFARVMVLGWIACGASGCGYVLQHTSVGAFAPKLKEQAERREHIDKMAETSKASTEKATSASKDAASWETAAHDAAELDFAIMFPEQKEPNPDDRPAHDVATSNVKRLYAMDPANDYSALSNRLRTTVRLQFDADLTSTLKIDEAVPKYSKLMTELTQADGGLASIVKAKEEGVCALVLEESDGVRTSLVDNDDAAEAANQKAKGTKVKKTRASVTRERATTKERSKTAAAAASASQSESTPPATSSESQSPSERHGAQAAATPPSSRPTFFVRADSSKSKKMATVKCYFPKALKSYTRDRADRVVIQSSFNFGESGNVTMPHHITPSDNVNTSESSFEISLESIVKTFANAKEHHRGDWGIVSIEYVADKKAGRTVRQFGSALQVDDQWQESVLAHGSFAIKWR